jgi:uncharacterized SAM-binding protein YcdF (DUF218 family)
LSLGIGFLIKKFLSFLLMPLTLMVALILIAIWSLHKNNIKRAKRYLLLALVWLFFITSAPLSSLLLFPLENQYQLLVKIPPNIEYILLLGGDRERRTWEGARLYHQIPDVKIITSGYSRYNKVSEAEKISRLLQQAGVKKDDILMQDQAKDTKEEALAIRKRLGTKPFLLVTSSYHMPRAMKIFTNTGLHPIAAPADFNDRDDDSIGSFFEGKQLLKTEKALHEYIGWLWITLKIYF